MSRLVRSLAIGLPLFLLAPDPAPAQTLVTPFIGAGVDYDTLDGVRSVYGVSAGYWSTIPIGVEVDFGFQPDYFPKQHPDADHHVVGDIWTLSMNVLIGVPFGGREGAGFRPYFTGGLVFFGLDVDEPSSLFDVRGTDVGFDVGGGAFVLFSDHIGLRGDVRYLKDPRERVQRISNARFVGEVLAFDAFSFTRTTAGFVWRF